jgi:hypothetical protein
MEHWETNWNRDVLGRIVALLFALADLADLASGLSALHRRRVLGILSCGEAEARAFLVGTATDAQAPACAPERTGDAACLAARFRALALLLCALLTQGVQFTLPSMGGPRAFWRNPAAPAGRRAAVPAPDTS